MSGTLTGGFNYGCLRYADELGQLLSGAKASSWRLGGATMG
jgi:hypothetical protein